MTNQEIIQVLTEPTSSMAETPSRLDEILAALTLRQLWQLASDVWLEMAGRVSGQDARDVARIGADIESMIRLWRPRGSV